MGGRSSNSNLTRVSTAVTPVENIEDARRRFNSLKRSASGQVRFSFNGLTATITKVTPGYRTAGGSNLMYSVSVDNDNTGENIFRTNRRGSDAWTQAKDDAKQYLGLKTEDELYPWRRGRRR